MSRYPDCSALILAGGESRRMGRDKATLPLDDQPLWQHVHHILHPLFADIFLSVRRPRPDLPSPQLCDAPGQAGPLAGLRAGLAACPTPWLFVTACDMPFLQPELIATLAAQRTGQQVVIPSIEGHWQPLAAFYARSCLPYLDTLLTTRPHAGIRHALTDLPLCVVDAAHLRPADPELCSFFDLDTPQDWQSAQRR